MAEITAYPTGTPSASDLVLGTELADPNVAGDTNKTRNFTIKQIADIATNSGTLFVVLFTPLNTIELSALATKNKYTSEATGVTSTAPVPGL